MTPPPNDTTEPQPVTDPAYLIAEFDVYLIEGGWRAVLTRDHTVVVEEAVWSELFWQCVGKRCAHDLREYAARFERQQARRVMPEDEASEILARNGLDDA